MLIGFEVIRGNSVVMLEVRILDLRRRRFY